MGIDYGLGITNIDLKTGIRYGVISIHDVEFFHDESEPYYPECECDECECEPLSWYIDNDEYSMETCMDNCEIMIYKSPYYTTGGFCSPCLPGAVDLNAFNAGDVRGYCLGHEWYPGEKAPYTVYSVETGKEVRHGN